MLCILVPCPSTMIKENKQKNMISEPLNEKYLNSAEKRYRQKEI